MMVAQVRRRDRVARSSGDWTFSLRTPLRIVMMVVMAPPSDIRVCLGLGSRAKEHFLESLHFNLMFCAQQPKHSARNQREYKQKYHDLYLLAINQRKHRSTVDGFAIAGDTNWLAEVHSQRTQLATHRFRMHAPKPKLLQAETEYDIRLNVTQGADGGDIPIHSFGIA
jgi:hypothetical protein